MAGILNMRAYIQLFDEDIAWLLEQPRTLERDHIRDCLVWMRDNKHLIEDCQSDGKMNNA